MPSAVASLYRALKDKQRGRRGHISEIAQDRPGMRDLVPLDAEGRFGRLENFSPARMKQEALHVGGREAVPGEKLQRHAFKIVLHQAWKIGAQHHAEAILF